VITFFSQTTVEFPMDGYSLYDQREKILTAEVISISSDAGKDKQTGVPGKAPPNFLNRMAYDVNLKITYDFAISVFGADHVSAKNRSNCILNLGEEFL
jgi:hypothetical protein